MAEVPNRDSGAIALLQGPQSLQTLKDLPKGVPGTLSGERDRTARVAFFEIAG